jgi:hypothetical protein
MLYSCDFDHESLQEQACGLKYHSGSRPGQHCTITRIFLHLMRGGRWMKPTNDRKGSLYRIYYLASGTIF